MSSTGLSRRSFLGAASGSFAGLALADLFARDGLLSGTLHHPPRAKRVVQLFMAGAASHVDTFDHKPLLAEQDGRWESLGTAELDTDAWSATVRVPNWDASQQARYKWVYREQHRDGSQSEST